MPTQQVLYIRVNKSKAKKILLKVKAHTDDSSSKEDEPCFKCPHCDKTFKQNGNMHTHMMRHHGTGKPSTRIDRNNLRKIFMASFDSFANKRFITIEDISSSKPRRFTVHDTANESKVVDGFSEKLSSRNAEIVADNLNIILGLKNNKDNKEFAYHWSDITDAVESLKNDRPKQAPIIERAFDVIMTL